MRSLRKIFDVGLPISGMFLVFLAALGIQDLQLRIVLLLVGLMFIHVGVWKLANPLYPNERHYHALRLETDRFIALVRDLNQLTMQAKSDDTSEAWQRRDQLVQQMHRCVDTMVALAGRTEGDPDPDKHRPFQSSSTF